MKKNFAKKLALGLALVMTVGSVNMPVAAEAASSPAFKSTAVKLEVGQTKKYSMNNEVKNRWSVKKFVIGNKKVAEITAQSKAGKGKTKYVKVTGVAEGTTTLRADVKAYVSKKEKQIRIPVTVTAAAETPETPEVTTAELTSVTQKTANSFEVTFTADASQTFTAESFKVESTDKIYTPLVDNVKFSTDGKSAVVTVYSNFIDKTVYDVTCGEKTASFTASVGSVANAVITTVQAQENVATKIEYVLYDANGIDVTNAADVDTYLSLSVDDADDSETSDVTKATLTMYNVGDKATVTLVYHKYDDSEAKEITATGTVVCVDAKATVGKTTYFAQSKTTVTPKIYLNSFEANTTIYEDSATADCVYYFAALDENGDAIEYDTYEMESSNDDVIGVTELETSGKYAKMEVTPIKAGSAKVIIKATKNDKETVYYGSVIVKAERKLHSVTLSKASLSVSNKAVHDYDYVVVTLLDQYGNKFKSAKTDVSVAMKNTEDPVIATEDNTDLSTYGVSYVDINAKGIDNYGSPSTIKKNPKYTVNVTVSCEGATKDYEKQFTVNVNNSTNDSGNYKYKVELDGSKTESIDLNPEIRAYSNVRGKVLVRVAKYIGNVFMGYHTITANDTVTVTRGAKAYQATISDPTEDTVGLYDNDNYVKAATVGAIGCDGFVLQTVTGGAVGLIEGNGIAVAASYKVKVVIDGEDADTTTHKTADGATLTVKNTMEVPSIRVDSTTGEGTDVALIKDCVTVDVDVLSNTPDASIENIWNKDYEAVVANGSKYTAAFVEVTDTFNTVEYRYFVKFNKTLVSK